jgi:hypothetical protein
VASAALQKRSPTLKNVSAGDSYFGTVTAVTNGATLEGGFSNAWHDLFARSGERFALGPANRGRGSSDPNLDRIARGEWLFVSQATYDIDSHQTPSVPARQACSTLTASTTDTPPATPNLILFLPTQSTFPYTLGLPKSIQVLESNPCTLGSSGRLNSINFNATVYPHVRVPECHESLIFVLDGVGLVAYHESPLIPECHESLEICYPMCVKISRLEFASFHTALECCLSLNN